MPHLALHSPVDELTLFEEDGNLVALEWGWAPGGEKTPLLLEAKKQLDAYFDGALKSFLLPMTPKGTVFQKRLWTTLGNIPYGGVWTYGKLADVLGSAPRAAGTGCGRNPLPILIPCHRVVAGDGALTGYSGGKGVVTKAHLLMLEGVTLKDMQHVGDDALIS